MIRKILKWLGIVCLTPFILFIIVFILLYVPPVQNYLKEKATAYASEATGMQIGIERISLSFPLNLVVKGVEVVSEKDTLLSAGELTVKVQLLPLIKKQVEVNGVALKKITLNSAGLIDGMQVQGSLGAFFLESHGVDLGKEEAIINRISLKDADIKLCLNDTTETPKDSTSTEINWKVLLYKLSLDNVAFTLDMPLDSLNLSANIRQAELKNGNADLKEQLYGLSLLEISNASFNFNSGNTVLQEGFDPSHIALQDINIALDSLKYHDMKEVAAVIRQITLRERSGLEVTSLAGRIESGKSSIQIPSLRLETPFSYIDLSAMVDWSTIFTPDAGNASAKLIADIGKQDVLLFTGELTESFQKEYPFRPLVLRADVEGNMQEMRLNELRAELPGAFHLAAKGKAEALLDSINRKANVNLNAETDKLDFVLALLDDASRKKFAIPRGMTLQGDASMKGSAYDANITFTENTGKIRMNAGYNDALQAYHASLQVDSLQIHDFMPMDSIYSLSATVTAKGQGFDFLSSRTTADVHTQIDDFHYAHYDLSGIELNATLANASAKVALDSDNPLVDMQARLNAMLSRKKIEAELDLNVPKIDFYRLRLTDKPFTASLNFDLKAATNLKDELRMKGEVANLKLQTPEKSFAPKDIRFSAATSRDSTLANINAGDLRFSLQAKGGVERIMKEASRFTEKLTAQLEKKEINQTELREVLPGICLRISAGDNNPLSNYLSASGIGFNELLLDIDTSPTEGINGDSYIYSLHTDSLQLDTIRFVIRQDTAAIKFAAGITNGPQNKQFVFKAMANGEIHKNNAQLLLKYLNEKGETGVLLGIKAQLREQGISFHLFPEQPTLVFRPFELNKDNYIFLRNDKHIKADLSLFDKNGTGLKLYSLPDTTALQDIAVELRRIELREIREIVPYMPDISGLVSAEAHYVQTEQTLQLAADLRVDSFTYEKDLIGNIALGAVYLPGDTDDHHLDAHLSHNDTEVVNINGVYHTSGEGNLSANVEMEHFPLSIANAFIPEHMATLEGNLDGDLTVKGALSKPLINGKIIMDSTSVAVPQYGVKFHFDERPILVNANRMVFDKFNIYTRGKNPFVIDGNVDFSDFSTMTADLKMNAQNYELVNAAKTKESQVYGKVFIDLASVIRGPLDALNVRGNITLLGNTNITYILTDSPLTVQDRLGDLVTFVDFNDTTQVQKEQVPTISLGGIDMLMTVQIDQAARVNADLNPDGSYYVRLEGGGDLSLQYTEFNGLLLSGRYTLSSGSMKYGFMGMVNREFSIQNGSYVDWSGNPMDPLLNLTAINNVRASVPQGDDGGTRMVNFQASITIKNQLENLSLTFNLSAPEDATIQNELSAMSDEERSKQAVAMMVTGSYLGAGGGSGMNLGNSALNSLLNGAIQDILGNVKAVDISLGMETNNASGGGTQTDYSFRVSKRFWNDRINVVIGGKISTGDNVQQGDQTFIDNVSIEYRLDNSGTRYIRLFHDKNYDSILDGEITETGVGLVLRKKMSRLGELFIFRKKKPTVMNE